MAESPIEDPGLFSRRLVAHAAAGSAGSLIAMLLLYPLDRVRTAKQLGDTKLGKVAVLRELVRTQGFLGIYSGLRQMLVALGIGNFAYFYIYTALRQALQYFRHRRGLGRDIPTLYNVWIAAVAGVVNVVITTPLWVVYTRVAAAARLQQPGQPKKTHQYKGIGDALWQIARKEGVTALWSGMTPSLILVSNPTVQFVAYERLKGALLFFRVGWTSKVSATDAAALPLLSSAEYLVLGAAAKMAATLMTYPLQVAQTRLRAERNERSATDCQKGAQQTPVRFIFRCRTVDCMAQVVREDGIRGLFAGMDAKLWQTCLTSAFMFTCYEHISRAIIWIVLPGDRQEL
eukprot:TRINITY_DN75060_c0_g1_i1.p1 TRINITY_DN75060_c0_g1~~TRINITY_DN75060_c0_g1_i1.p1  ORF type:complete len:390 (+),score=42.45 TRINITY_DN75060_c0_g1_i1:136-1170(+)